MLKNETTGIVCRRIHREWEMRRPAGRIGDSHSDALLCPGLLANSQRPLNPPPWQQGHGCIAEFRKRDCRVTRIVGYDDAIGSDRAFEVKKSLSIGSSLKRGFAARQEISSGRTLDHRWTDSSATQEYLSADNCLSLWRHDLAAELGSTLEPELVDLLGTFNVGNRRFLRRVAIRFNLQRELIKEMDRILPI